MDDTTSASDLHCGLLVGHRGCRLPNLPENSMPAFKYALARGASIELDCRLTGDNQVIVLHDETLVRTMQTDCRTPVNKMPLHDILALRYRKDETCKNARIPMLEDVIELLQVHNKNVPSGKRSRLFLEIKEKRKCGGHVSRISKMVCGLVGRYSCNRDVVIICFNPLVLAFAKRFSPSIATCLLVGDNFYKKDRPASFPLSLGLKAMDWVVSSIYTSTWFLKAIGAEMTGPNWKRVSAEKIDFYHNSGIGVYVWTVNDMLAASWLQDKKCSIAVDFIPDSKADFLLPIPATFLDTASQHRAKKCKRESKKACPATRRR